MKSLSKGLTIVTILLFEMTFGSGEASAFPELIKDGYSRCSACHWQPTGGGPLNPYGKTIAGEHLSTWGSASEAETLYGLANLDPIELSGDYRYLNHHFSDEGVTINQKFAMQKEISIVLKAAPNVTFLASGGLYGFEPKEMEYRRYFGIVRLGNLWSRVGRFIPSFGYNLPDHTKGTKELFGQGSESLNVEVGYSYKWLEIIGTRLLGGDSELVAGEKPKVNQRDARDGSTLSIGLHPFKSLHVGVSAFVQQDSEALRKYYSYHASGGLGRFYFLAEYQSHPLKAYRAYGEIGVEAFRGFHVKAEIDAREKFEEVFGTIDLFPRPHWQFTASFSKRQRIFVSHYYL